MKNKVSFIAGELFTCLVQSAIFFLISVFISNFFQDEKGLEDFILSKINNLTLKEFMFTCFAVIVIAGLLTLFNRIFKNMNENLPFLEKAIDKTLIEIPKTLYLLSSSIGTLGIVIGFISDNQHIIIMYSIIWISYFIFGCCLSFLLTPKPQN
ncbi:hypothetical protein [Moraxella oblonga]|uniref:hypothetical protein n=1 Tax=Moraxella oblonga TaxID=200413 RepID=UPI000833F046|nr:hypothetical protein [Moraxella oblonga]